MAYPGNLTLIQTEDFGKEQNPLPIYAYFETKSNLTWYYNQNSKMWVSSGGGTSGNAAWGSIGGNITSQTDLISALTFKLNTANPTLTGTLTAPNVVSDSIIVKQLATPILGVITPTGTTQTLNLSSTSYFDLDLSSATGNVTLTLQNPTAGATWVFCVKQGTNARTLIFPTGTVQATSPNRNVWSSFANKTNEFSVFYDGVKFKIRDTGGDIS